VEKEQQTDNTLLENIAKNDPKILEKLYNDYRRPFIVWAIQAYRCEEEDAIEIFQKAFTVMYLNVKNKKLVTLTSSLKTYIFSIGKNLFRERFRDKHSQYVAIDETNSNTILADHLDNSILDEYQNAHQREVVRALLHQIGDPCRKLLQFIFIDGMPPKEVITAMGYSDDRVVRKRKSLCLKQLREMTVTQKDKND
jgi:RNA polymerase sigma-70 factor (ECF subfamily)